MIKVLHIEIQSNLGGIESLLINMLCEINSKKFQFDFVTTSNELPYEKRLNGFGGSIYKIDSIGSLIKYTLGIKRVIKEGGYDIIHIHKNSLANIIPIVIAKYYNKRIIVHAHNTKPKIDRKIIEVIHHINRYIIKNMDMCKIACSENAAEWMFGSTNNVEIFHNAINVSNFRRDEKKRRTLRTQFGLDGEIVIGHVGGHIRQKNLRFLLDVYQVVKKKIDNVKLVLIGDGEERKKLENYVKENYLEKEVFFLGMRSDVNELLNIMDFFVFPSKYEGLGIALVEAQINGIYCVASTECPLEAKISNYCEFFDLSRGEQWWGEQIVNLIKKENKISKKVDYASYDMKNEIKYLERIYMDIVQ